MKFAAYILSVYILLLLIVPCCTFDNCASDKMATTQAAPDPHKPGDKDGCGNCSPFSFCQHCNGSINSFKPSDLRTQPVTDNPKRQYISFPKFYYPLFIANIWQPPKIA